MELRASLSSRSSLTIFYEKLKSYLLLIKLEPSLSFDIFEIKKLPGDHKVSIIQEVTLQASVSFKICSDSDLIAILKIKNEYSDISLVDSRATVI